MIKGLKRITDRIEWIRLIILRKSIELAYRKSTNEEILELVNNMKQRGLQPFLGDFAQKYDNFDVKVMREGDNGYFWVMHHGEKLFFEKSSYEKGVAIAYMKLCREQDVDSPHRYIEDYRVLKDCYVVEAGAAEASFSLDAIINDCKKVYICECNQGWIDSLNRTFSQYGNRAQVIKKYVSSIDSEDTITIDSIFQKAAENDGFSFKKDKIFIKMDIEGMEEEGIKGMQYVLKHAQHISLSICAYHNQDDEKIIRSYFPEDKWIIETSKSYILFPYDKKQKKPYFRRGVLRIKKR